MGAGRVFGDSPKKATVAARKPEPSAAPPDATAAAPVYHPIDLSRLAVRRPAHQGPRDRASLALLLRADANAEHDVPAGADAVTIEGRTTFAPGRADARTFAGRSLIGHEAAHAAQQARGAGMPRLLMESDRSTLEAEADRAGEAYAAGRTFETTGRAPPTVPLFAGKPKLRIIVRLTLFDADDKILLEFSEGPPLLVPAVYNGHPKHDTFHVPAGKGHTDVIRSGTPNARGFVIEWNAKGVAPVWTAAHDVVVVAHIGSGDGHGTGLGAGQGQGTAPGAKSDPAAGTGPSTPAHAPVGGDGALSQDDLEAWRDLAALLGAGDKGTLSVSVPELLRFYRLIRKMVDHPTFAAQGEDMVRFARFLQENRERISGTLQSGPRSTMTLDQLKSVITQYGQFIAGQPLDPADRMTDEKFDKEFQYDPGWQRLSKADKKLLLQFAKLSPGEARGAKVDFDHVTVQMKLAMALKLSKSWPAEILEAATAAFSDWVFITTLILTMVVYVGLWLTPDPSMVTKILAGALTLYLWASFAWSDIYGLAKAFSALIDDCNAATTVAELEVAGNTFAVKVGSVGFDILMMIAMWRLGKSFGAKVRAGAAERGVARAEASVAEAEAQPGSGVVPKATPGVADPVTLARTKAGAGAGAGAVLDALSDQLSEAGRKGLRDLRSKAGDAQALKSVEGRAAGGQDVARYLADRAVTGDARAAVEASVRSAKLRLARARLIQSSVIADPALRAQARAAAIRLVVEALAERGLLDKLPKDANSRPFGDLIAALGEALSRNALAEMFPEADGYRILANVMIVKEVPGFRTLADWKAAGNRTAGYYEADGRLWKAQGEVDSMVVKKGAGGRLSPTLLEQVKTGSGDTGTRAATQNTAFVEAVRKMTGGDPSYRFFEKTSGERVGTDWTRVLDWSDLDNVVQQTSGPEGKTGFGMSLGFDADTLAALARSIAESLPPARAQGIPPVPSKRDDKPAAAR